MVRIVARVTALLLAVGLVPAVAVLPSDSAQASTPPPFGEQSVANSAVPTPAASVDTEAESP